MRAQERRRSHAELGHHDDDPGFGTARSSGAGRGAVAGLAHSRDRGRQRRSAEAGRARRGRRGDGAFARRRGEDRRCRPPGRSGAADVEPVSDRRSAAGSSEDRRARRSRRGVSPDPAPGATFVSRGDESGTHRKEQEIARAAGLDPNAWASPLVSTGQGQGETVLVASQRAATRCATRRRGRSSNDDASERFIVLAAPSRWLRPRPAPPARRGRSRCWSIRIT